MGVRTHLHVCADAYRLLLDITLVRLRGLMRCAYQPALCMPEPRLSLIRLHVCFRCSQAVEY